MNNIKKKTYNYINLKKGYKNIIGKGFLAKNLKKYNLFFKKKNYYLYVAGVSNSFERNKFYLKKDFNRIKKFVYNLKTGKLIYISSCSIFDPNRNNSLYIKNKIKIENFIKKNCKNYLIIRLPEIVGKNNNKNTLTNFLYNQIINSKTFNVYINAKRNLLDINDVVKIILFFLKKNSDSNYLNIANLYFTSPLIIVKLLEKITNKKAKYKISNKKLKNWKIINNLNVNILKKIKIKFNKDYVYELLKKYYVKNKIINSNSSI